MTGYWRDIALDKSSLWTYINWSGKQPKKKAQLWLKRSRLAPLRISLTFEEGFDPKPAQMESVMNFLKQRISRWESFSVHVTSEALQVALELCCGVPAPALKRLSIRCPETGLFEDEIVLFAEKTPRLRSLQLSGLLVPWTGPLFENLTVLDLADYEEETAPSIEHLASMLQRSPDLQELILHSSGITDSHNSDDFRPSTITMPSLKRVQMTDKDRDFSIWMTGYLRAPKVHTVIANPVNSDRDPDAIAIMSKVRLDSTHELPFPNTEIYRSQYGMCVIQW